jgi:hypothetical protein
MFKMNYMLIFGLIAVIAIISVVAYFMLGKKDEDIKHGKYVIKREDGRNKSYMIVSKDSVEIGDYRDNLPMKKMDFKLIKLGTTFKIDDKELPVFEASIPIDNRPAYFAQSLDDSILILGKDPSSGTFSVLPVKLVPTQTL